MVGEVGVAGVAALNLKRGGAQEDPIRAFARLSFLFPWPKCLSALGPEIKNPTTFVVGSSWSGWQDSNLRPPAPKAGAITGLRYTPRSISFWIANIVLNTNIRPPNRFIIKKRCLITAAPIQLI